MFLESINNLTFPLIMLALGIYFKPKLVQPKLLVFTLLVRPIGGLLVGFILLELFQIQGIARSIVLICAASPVGYNTLVFSSLTKLNVEFAANLVSTSVGLGIFYIPILILFFY